MSMRKFFIGAAFWMNHAPINNITNVIISKTEANDNFIIEIALLFKKMTKIKIIDLSFNNLTYISMNSFSNNLIYINELKELNLSMNNLGSKGIINLSNNIGKCLKLEILNLSYTEMGNDGFILLINQLKEKNKLNKLICSGNSISDISFKKFCKEAESFKYIILLDFENCQIGNDGMKALYSNFTKFKKLENLNLARNKFNDDGILYFKGKFNNIMENIIYLNIKGNDISDGIKEFLIEQGIPSTYLL